jgi:hypothetical protein
MAGPCSNEAASSKCPPLAGCWTRKSMRSDVRFFALDFTKTFAFDFTKIFAFDVTKT